jgi:hypothetical protein
LHLLDLNQYDNIGIRIFFSTPQRLNPLRRYEIRRSKDVNEISPLEHLFLIGQKIPNTIQPDGSHHLSSGDLQMSTINEWGFPFADP